VLNRPEAVTNNKDVQQITEISNTSHRDFTGTPSSVIKQPFPVTRSHYHVCRHSQRFAYIAITGTLRNSNGREESDAVTRARHLIYKSDVSQDAPLRLRSRSVIPQQRPHTLELIMWRCDICDPSVQQHSTATVTSLKPGVVSYKLPEITSTYTEKYMRYTSPFFPGGTGGRGVGLTPHPHLVPRS